MNFIAESITVLAEVGTLSACSTPSLPSASISTILLIWLGGLGSPHPRVPSVNLLAVAGGYRQLLNTVISWTWFLPYQLPGVVDLDPEPGYGYVSGGSVINWPT